MDSEKLKSKTTELEPENVPYEILNYLVRVENHMKRIRYILNVFMVILCLFCSGILVLTFK